MVLADDAPPQEATTRSNATNHALRFNNEGVIVLVQFNDIVVVVVQNNCFTWAITSNTYKSLLAHCCHTVEKFYKFIGVIPSAHVEREVMWLETPGAATMAASQPDHAPPPRTGNIGVILNVSDL